MASTYTNNSGIEKPGSGEQAGTWGTTANLNYDIIDRALSGVVTLTLSGTSSTITTTDATLSNGHYKVLVLTGTPSGTHTITISPNDQQKIYFVQNSTSQSVVFSQGTGANVTVAAGKGAIIYANGNGSSASVAEIETSTSDPTFTTLDVTTSTTLTGDMLLTGAFPDGTLNVAVGTDALGGASSSVTSGNYNVAVGASPLQGATTGDYNVAVGYDAMGLGTVTGSNNIAIGQDAGSYITNGGDNVLLGHGAGESLNSGAENVFIGKDAGSQEVNGNNSVSIGAGSGQSLNGGSGNAFVGSVAGRNVNTGTYNVAIGFYAGDGNETGDSNVAIGNSAGDGTESDTLNNVAIGLYAGQFTSSRGHDISIGAKSNYQARATTSGFFYEGNNIAIGTETNGGLSTNTSTQGSFSENIAIGYQAASYLLYGSENIFIGRLAGPSLNSTVGTGPLNYNVGIGRSALERITDGLFNVAIGYDAGPFLTSGDNNILIGKQAGDFLSPSGAVTTGDNNICIGNNSIANAYVRVSWTVTSDIRDKTNIGDVPHGLEFLSNLKPISYQHVESRESGTPHGDVRYGYSAQDILALEGDSPVIINNKNDESLSLNETAMIPVLHNAILELSEQNKALKARLDAAGL